jgi:citrate synthase
MIEQAELNWDGKKAVLPLVTGTAGERAIDISKLRDQTGLITLDNGYGNTGSCKSAITFIDGEKGILRYRGIPIEGRETSVSSASSKTLSAWLSVASS